MRSVHQLVHELKTAPEQWMDTAIVVAFESRFEFVREDHPDTVRLLDSLQQQGGLAIGLAGIGQHGTGIAFFAEVFHEYKGQAWAHRYMETLRRIVSHFSLEQ
jgi:hypothetical protein